MEKFIWNIPDFSQGLQFTTETVFFLLEIALICVGICFCIRGYRSFRSIFLCGSAVFLGYLSLLISEQFFTSLLFKMVFFVAFVFVGVCLTYLVTVFISQGLKAIRIQAWLVKYLFLITPILGGLLIAATVYATIYRSIVLACVLLALTAACGIVLQFWRKSKLFVGYTYEDILKMER